jgi:hypothetical protein
VKAELTYHRLHTITRTLAGAVGRSRHYPPRLYLAVASGQVSFTAGYAVVAGQVTTDGGMADGHTSVDLAEFTGALTAVAATGRGKATIIVRLDTEPGLLHLAAASSAAIPTSDEATVPQRLASSGGGLVVAVPVPLFREAVATVAAAAATAANAPRELHDIRLWRDPGSCLVLEAADRQRVHRVVIGEPDGDRFEARLPATSAALGFGCSRWPRTPSPSASPPAVTTSSGMPAASPPPCARSTTGGGRRWSRSWKRLSRRT